LPSGPLRVRIAPRSLVMEGWFQEELRMSRLLTLGVGVILLLTLPGCPPATEMQPFQPRPGKDYSKPLPPGALALRKIDPKDYPDFRPGFYNRAGLKEAIAYSLEYLAKPSSHKYFPYGDISHARAVASLKRFSALLDEVQTADQLDQTIRRDFEVYQSVGCDDCGTVYYTGYYTPIFEGRQQRDSRFCYPLYKLPPDLKKDEEGRTLGRVTPDGRIVPYYTRRQIEEGGLLDGTEIAWLKDPFEAYVVTVQGSAKLRLPGGTLYELGYAANNGLEYTPVSKRMIADGVIGRNELSLQTLLRYFAKHPDQVHRYCWENGRYVFFREAPGGPFGSINVPVTPYRSIATDKEVFPRACLAFVKTNLPRIYDGSVQVKPYAAFALDQDTGGAIRAAGRCDVFMGVGQTAEAVAGRSGAEGALYYIFVRPGGSGIQE
jgi:membrane-bound lytic murein transglycosylase A